MEYVITFPGGLRVDAQYKDVTIATDQSVKGGGEGSAPTPVMCFLSSVGTCAGFYVLQFCRSRDLPTDGIRLTQQMTLDPETHLVTTISIDIHVPPDFPAKYHSALVRAADQCTVKKHFETPPSISVQTVADA